MIRTVALVVAAQVVATGLAVAPQLSARLTGEEVRLRVEPVDPIDPFRGAYVALDYPDLRADGSDVTGGIDDGERGDVFVSLLPAGNGLMEASSWSRTRPSGGTYLACDDRGWRLDCGIDSWFVPQDEARALEDAVQEGDVVAVLKVDGRGHAAIVDLDTGRR